MKMTILYWNSERKIIIFIIFVNFHEIFTIKIESKITQFLFFFLSEIFIMDIFFQTKTNDQKKITKQRA